MPIVINKILAHWW